MSASSDLLAAHQRSPQGLGRMSEADGIGNIGSIVVGRALRWYVQIVDGRIAATRFQVFNCQEMVAPASVLVGLVDQMPVAEAAAIDVDALTASEPDLAREDLPVVVWPVLALRLALHDAGVAVEVPEPDAELEAMVCRCLGISDDDLRGALADQGDPQGVDPKALAAAVAAETGAGSRCGSCRRDVDELIAEWTGAADRAAAPAAAPRPIQGRVALMHRIDEALHDLLAEAEGRVQLWDLRGTEVVLRIDADLADAERRGWPERIERRLRDEVDPTLGVAIADD